MYYKLIACKILERELASLTYNCDNRIDITMIQQQKHDRPEKLHELLQNEIDLIDADRDIHSNKTDLFPYDAILIGYGLCSNATVGLTSNKYPIVIPKAHDCVTLLLGNKERYNDYYHANTGTFYYWPDIEEIMGMGAEDRTERQLQKFLTHCHGNKKRAQHLLDIQEDMTCNYQKLANIKWNEIQMSKFDETAHRICSRKGWKYEELKGDSSLLGNMLDGIWNDEQFVVIPPGKSVCASFDCQVMKCCDVKETSI